MIRRPRPIILISLGVSLAGCVVAGQAPGAVSPTSSPVATSSARTATPAPTAVPSPSPSPSGGCTYIRDVPDFAPLQPEPYCIDLPVKGPASTVRVTWDIPAEGWNQWIGAFRLEPNSDRHVALTVATISNLVVDGCHDHRPLDPPVGPNVDDLATAFSRLQPYEVIAPPADITKYGYRGKGLTLRSPVLPTETRRGDEVLKDCVDGTVWSWISPAIGHAFYGYSGGEVSKYWILDVDGTRVTIATSRFPESPKADVAELERILDSIRIERQ